MASDEQIDIVAKHYIIAALWADCVEETHPQVPKKEAAAAREVCRKFIEQCEAAGGLFTQAMACFDDGYGKHPDAGSAEAAFGHDLWLTSQGHGVGFWDRKRDGLPEKLWRALTEQARKLGVCNHYQQKGWWYFDEN